MSMDKLELEALTPDQMADYLRNKHQGGRNFAKGHTFENKVAVREIAKSIDEFLNDESAEKHFQSQGAHFFVDDLVIELTDNRHHCRQIKDVADLSWGNGKKGSLAFDFLHQLKASADKAGSIGLIVSDEALAEKMRANKPDELSACSVEHFPAVVWTTLVKSDALKVPLVAIARHPNPSNDLLVGVAKAICGEWEFNEGRARTSQIMTKLVTRFLRTRQSDEEALAMLKPEVSAILTKIPDFAYSISRGYFHYTYIFTEQSLPFDCFSPTFQAFQSMILEKNPTEFEGPLEDILNTWSFLHD